jgi:hypothetical protein
VHVNQAGHQNSIAAVDDRRVVGRRAVGRVDGRDLVALDQHLSAGLSRGRLAVEQLGLPQEYPLRLRGCLRQREWRAGGCKQCRSDPGQKPPSREVFQAARCMLDFRRRAAAAQAVNEMLILSTQADHDALPCFNLVPMVMWATLPQWRDPLPVSRPVASTFPAL